MNRFRASFSRSMRWIPVGTPGLEHLTVVAGPDGMRARGVVIGERGGRPYGARYLVEADWLWRTTGFSVETTDGRRLSMASEVAGVWRYSDGRAAPELDGAIDLDLAATPFTNTLPIRRHWLEKGQSREFTMLYVAFDTLEARLDEQRYTCLEPCRSYLYEAVDRSFAARLSVDDDGLVTDYPALFTRLA